MLMILLLGLIIEFGKIFLAALLQVDQVWQLVKRQQFIILVFGSFIVAMKVMHHVVV